MKKVFLRKISKGVGEVGRGGEKLNKNVILVKFFVF